MAERGLFETLWTPIPSWLQQSLQSRRENRNELIYPKSAWVRVISNFDDGKVLMGGALDKEDQMKFGFKNMYDFSGDQNAVPPRRPIPGIQSISITEEGSWTEVDIQWKAWSLDQLEDLTRYFLNPGISVVVEVGWEDVPFDAVLDPKNNSDIIDMYRSLTNLAGEQSVLDYRQHPRFKRMERSNGKYLIVPGMIYDFSFDMNEQGGFDVTTNVHTVAESAFSLSTRVNEGERGEDSYSVDIIDFVREELHFVSRTPPPANNPESVGFTQTSETSRDLILSSSQTVKYAEKISDGLFISWGEVEDIFNEHFGMDSIPHSGVKINEFNSSEIQISNFDTDSVAGESVFDLRSTDLDTCLVAAEDFRTQYTKKIPKFGGPYQSPFGPSRLQGETPEKTSQSSAGWLYHLYINTKLFKEAIEEKKDPVHAMLYMLNECSQSCFNIWDFDYVINEGTIVFFDKNFPTSKSVEEYLVNQGDTTEAVAYTFRPFTKNSQVKSMSFSSNLSNQMTSLIAAKNLVINGEKNNLENQNIIASASDATGMLFRRWESGSQEDLVLKEMQRVAEKRKDESEEKSQDKKADSRKSTSKSGATEDGSMSYESRGEEKRKKQIIENQNVQTGKFEDILIPNEKVAREVERLINGEITQHSPINANAIIDLTLSLTLNGISGLRRYQIIKVSHIPQFFRDYGVFIIDSVRHSVNNNNWTTEITAKYVVLNMYEKNLNNS